MHNRDQSLAQYSIVSWVGVQIQFGLKRQVDKDFYAISSSAHGLSSSKALKSGTFGLMYEYNVRGNTDRRVP